MADIIRDVVVRIRMDLEKTGEIRKAVEQTIGRDAEKAQIDSARRIVDSKKKVTEETRKNADQQIQIIRESAEKQARIEVAADRLREIRMRERLAAFKRQKAEEERIEQEKAAGQRKGFLGGGTENKAIAIASAVIAVANAPKLILGNITGLIKELRSGEFGKPAEELYGELGGLSKDLFGGNNFAKGFFDALTFGFVTWIEKQNAMQQPKRPGGVYIDGKPAAQSKADREFEALKQQATAQRELNQIIMQRTAAERELLAEQKRRIEFAKEEFGLLDAKKKQDVIAMAERIGKQGIGSLTPEELEFARQNQAFRGIISEQAKGFADAAGFERVVKALGLDRKIADAEAKITAEVKNVIDVNIDPANLAKSIEERIAPLIKELEERQIANLRTEIDKANKARANAVGAGF